MKSYFLSTMIVAGLALGMTGITSAQPGGPGGALGGFGGEGRGQDMLGLLRMESIQGEIELVDDQREEIEALQEELWSEMRERMSSVRDLEPEERRERFAELRTEMETQREQFQERIEAVLLPQQLKRLKELQVQSVARRSGQGSLGILQNETILEELGIDAEKREELEAKAEEVLAKLQTQIKKMKAEAEDEILSVLSSEQRKKFREKVGESFDFDSGNDAGFRGRGGRGGGPEGRGGRGGRGGRPDSDTDTQ